MNSKPTKEWTEQMKGKNQRVSPRSHVKKLFLKEEGNQTFQTMWVHWEETCIEQHKVPLASLFTAVWVGADACFQ